VINKRKLLLFIGAIVNDLKKFRIVVIFIRKKGLENLEKDIN